jgi:hypothetical protein
MLEALTAASFQPYLNDAFTIELENGSLELRLSSVPIVGQSNMAATDDRRQPFSLVFVEPGGRYLPQQIYRLAHPALGTLDIFLVPIGKDQHGLRLEAVFS